MARHKTTLPVHEEVAHPGNLAESRLSLSWAGTVIPQSLTSRKQAVPLGSIWSQASERNPPFLASPPAASALWPHPGNLCPLGSLNPFSFQDPPTAKALLFFLPSPVSQPLSFLRTILVSVVGCSAQLCPHQVLSHPCPPRPSTFGPRMSLPS